MFKSIISNENIEDGLTFTIFDDIFLCNIKAPTTKSGYRFRGARIKSLIMCYEERNLNVAANFSLFIKSRIAIDIEVSQMEIMKICFPEDYEKYKNDIDKYFLLL